MNFMKGRLEEVQLIVNSILNPKHRITTITGSSGLKKSNFAKFVAQRIYERGTFQDGIIFI